MKYENQTEYRNTEIKNIEIYLIHSNPIRDIFGGIFLWKSPGWERNGWIGKEVHGAICDFKI